MVTVSYAAAFVTGVLTFFATCLLPVLPVYIGYLGGLGVDQDVAAERAKPFYRRKVFVHSLFFVAGFLVVFSSLGIAATALGRILATYRIAFQKVGAILLALLGISMLDFIRVPFLSSSAQINFNKQHAHLTKAGAFVFGLTFGFAWTPCIGPVLATILFIASQGTSIVYGASLLGVFALGLGIPFIIVGALFEAIGPKLAGLGKWTQYIRYVFAILIIIIAIVLYTGHLGSLSQWIVMHTGSLVM